MKTVFPKPFNEDEQSQAVLKSAVQIVCDELVDVHRIEGVKLALLIDVIARAILEKFKCGQRDASLLARYATAEALGHLGRKPN